MLSVLHLQYSIYYQNLHHISLFIHVSEESFVEMTLDSTSCDSCDVSGQCIGTPHSKSKLINSCGVGSNLSVTSAIDKLCKMKYNFLKAYKNKILISVVFFL